MELTGAEQVANQLAAAYATNPETAKSTLDSLFAAEVDLRHLPPLASDGMVDGHRLAEGTGKEAAAITSVLVGLHHEEVTVDADRDRVHVTAWICGTLPNGKEARLFSDMWCTVSDGRIVGLEHCMDEDTMAAWIEVAVAAGMTLPEPPQDDDSP
ncbi:MAG TPA: hypothetical protein VID94_02495 [Acidimicrobiales bacterium]